MRNQATKRFAFAALAVIALGATPAFADACSGRSHDTGTALGAVGGAAIGGVATHSVGGAVIGGVAGAFAGNAIARSSDCNRHSRHVRHYSRHHHDYYVDRHGRRHYYYR